MKTIKQYNEKEILDLTQSYNKLVKNIFKINNQYMAYLLTEAHDYEGLDLPYYEINSNKTLSGRSEEFYFEWQS